MNNSKKRSVRIVAALLAIIMVIGGTFAFFTDSALTSESGKAGTVDVELDASGINLLDEDGKLILNPGDGRDVDFTVSNKGNKSVDIRTIITLTSSVGMLTDENGQAEYEIYKFGDVEFVDGKGYMPKDGAQPLQIRSISDDGRTIIYRTPIYILNGNEELDDMEREIEPDVATDIDPYFDVSDGGSIASSKYVLVFKGASANAFQASEVSLNVHIDAKQHRNTESWVQAGDSNTVVPGNPDNTETYSVTYVVGGITDTTKVIPYLSSSLIDDTTKFYAGVDTGVFVDPNTDHPDWNGEMYEVTYVSVKTVGGETIELDENNRFITPAEDIIVTIEVEESDAIAAVYSTDRTFIGEYDNLDDAFAVAEQTAANDAANTVQTFSLFPRANAAEPVHVYVELLCDYALAENLVISTPYTITFTSNQERLAKAGKEEFTLYTNKYDYAITVSPVSSMYMDNVVIDAVAPYETTITDHFITNNGVFRANNTTFKNVQVSTDVIYNAPDAEMYLNDFSIEDCVLRADTSGYYAVRNEGNIYMSGTNSIQNNFYFGTDLGQNLYLDYTNGDASLHIDSNFNTNSKIEISSIVEGENKTIIYTQDADRLNSQYLNCFVCDFYDTDLMYFDGEIYYGKTPVYTDTYINPYGARYIEIPAGFTGTIDQSVDCYHSYGQLREISIPDDFSGTIFSNSPYLKKIYMNSTFDLYLTNTPITAITTKEMDNAIIVGENVTELGHINGRYFSDYSYHILNPAFLQIIDLKDSNVQSISDYAFASAVQTLRYVGLPETLRYVGYGAFYDTYGEVNASLSSVVLTTPEVELSNSAFYGATVYYTNPNANITSTDSWDVGYAELVSAESSATMVVDKNGILTQFKDNRYNVESLDLTNIVYINDNLEIQEITGFGANLLANNTKTTHVTFPASFTADKFDAALIENAPALKTITFEADGYANIVDGLIKSCGLDSIKFVKDGVETTAYPIVEGVTVDSNGKIVGMDSSISGEYTLVGSNGYAKTADGQYIKITGYGDNAFAGSAITSVIVPVDYSSVSANMFAGAESLTTVTIENSLVYNEDFVNAVFAANENIQTVNMAVADYTRLDYIYTTGQNSYMNTGLKPDINTDIKINYMVPKDPKATAAIFGAGDANLGSGMCYLHIYSGTTGAAGKPNLYGMANCGVFGQKCTVTMIGNTYSFYVNGELLLERSNDAAASFTSPQVMVLGCANAGGNIKYPLAAYIYDFQYYQNGELILDWVPAMVDGVAGMYNRVDGTFKAGGGSGVVAGTAIHNPDAEMQSFTR